MALTERLAIVVEANADKAVAQFKQLGAATKGLAGPVGEAGGLMSKFGGQLGGLASIAGPAAMAGLAAGFLKFASSGIEAFASLAGEVKSFRRVVGGSAEDASRLVAAFKAVGIDADTAAKGVFMLEKKIGTGTDALASFGVQVARDQQGNTNMAATLVNIADAYTRTTDQAQKAALVQAAFGRAGVSLLPFLAKGKEGIRDLYSEAERHHLILSDEDIARADELKVAMRNLKEAVQGIQVEAGRGLIPALVDIINLVDKALARADELQHGPAKGSKGGWWDTLTGALNQVETAISKISGGAYFPWLDPDFEGKTDGAAKSVEELAQETNDLGDAIQKSIDADRALAASSRSLEADKRSLAEDTRSYNELLKQGAVDTEKVADAQRSLSDATRSVGHAQREQAKAQDEFNKAQATAGILGTDTAADALADAKDNLADANDNVTSALERQQKAQKDLETARAGDPDYQYKLAAAKQKVADDTQSIADAEYQVGQKALAAATAHDVETAALNNKADATERLLANYNAILTLHPETYPALAPVIGAAQGALGAPSPGALSPVLPLGPQAGGGILGSNPLNVTFNNTFNTPQDPEQLARNLIWNLN